MGQHQETTKIYPSVCYIKEEFFGYLEGDGLLLYQLLLGCGGGCRLLGGRLRLADWVRRGGGWGCRGSLGFNSHLHHRGLLMLHLLMLYLLLLHLLMLYLLMLYLLVLYLLMLHLLMLYLLMLYLLMLYLLMLHLLMLYLLMLHLHRGL